MRSERIICELPVQYYIRAIKEKGKGVRKVTFPFLLCFGGLVKDGYSSV